MTAHVPIPLEANYAPQGYASGGGPARFRGEHPGEQPSPEDWIASVTTRWRLEPAGLSRLPDGRYLKVAIAEDPEAFLGPAHVAAFGADPGLLVKLLDSAKRLSVHAHPDDAFARHHLGCAHGKTEAWIVLASSGAGAGYVGFTREVARDELATWVAEQSVDAMLDNLHKLRLVEGSAVLVPAGVPHALGPGVLILELQQPTDLSIMLERRSPVGGDLGLGWDVALEAVDRSAWSRERLHELSGPGTGSPGRVLPAIADPFFRAELVVGDPVTRIEPGFAVIVGLAGNGELRGGHASAATPVGRGSTVLIPFGAGELALRGEVQAVVCRPATPRS